MSGSIITAGPSQKPELIDRKQEVLGCSMRPWLQTSSNSYLPDQDNVLQYLTRAGVVTVTVW